MLQTKVEDLKRAQNDFETFSLNIQVTIEIIKIRFTLPFNCLLASVKRGDFEIFFKANFESVANVHSWNW